MKNKISVKNGGDKIALCSRASCDVKSRDIIRRLISFCFIHIFDTHPFCCHRPEEKLTTRDTWLKSYGLLSLSDKPNELHEDHLTVGWRPVPSSFTYCVKSIFHPTNQTVNFWTHFIPFSVLLYQFYIIFNERLSGSVTDPLYYPLLVYAFGGCLILLVSSLAHLLNCYSTTVAETCWYCDYGSISLGMFGNHTVLYFYISPMSCMGAPISFYMTFLATSVLITHALACYARGKSGKLEIVIKTSSFAAMMFIGFVPGVYKVFADIFFHISSHGEDFFTGLDLQCQISTVTFSPFMILSLFCLCFGTMLEVTQFPQKYYPGTFDIVGHSHQLFHLWTALCIHIQTYAFEIAITNIESLHKDREYLTEKLNITWQETIGITSAVTVCCLIIIYYFTKNDMSKQKSQ